jgi:hypothetical protein
MGTQIVHVVYPDGSVEKHVEGDELWMADRGVRMNNPFSIYGDPELRSQLKHDCDIYFTIVDSDSLRVQGRGVDVVVTKDNLNDTIISIQEKCV